ncbi:hypothetical protein GXP67_16605 [Rhodocytophaga rosea]|uniref:Uncharacterized protein n=1 Tax=Rhodocytophaga rosea TaxID=2704465 RepID=A0A6C0GJC5_9BACT|nr:hypothetical protein [Rhodocytophaga rosea]QHT68146.1 hypothetical protein GXP67_16605 [Rhodocytophaga rosea]
MSEKAIHFVLIKAQNQLNLFYALINELSTINGKTNNSGIDMPASLQYYLGKSG